MYTCNSRGIMKTSTLSCRTIRAVTFPFLLCSLLMPAQSSQTSPKSGFNVGAPNDDILDHTRSSAATSGIPSQVNSPNRTVGPQSDGSIVVSTKQVVTH